MSMVSAQLLLLLCSLTDRPAELLALRSEMDDKETEASECNKQLQQVVPSAWHAVRELRATGLGAGTKRPIVEAGCRERQAPWSPE